MMSTTRSRSASRRVNWAFSFFSSRRRAALFDRRTAEARAPAVEAVFGDVVLAADFGDSLLALLGLLQDGDDLRVGELALLHLSILPFGSILTVRMIQFSEERSPEQKAA